MLAQIQVFSKSGLIRNCTSPGLDYHGQHKLTMTPQASQIPVKLVATQISNVPRFLMVNTPSDGHNGLPNTFALSQMAFRTGAEYRE